MLKTKPPKPRKCAVCGEIYTPVRINLKLTKVCMNPGCILDYAQGIRAKEQRKLERKQKKEVKANKVALIEFNKKDLSWQHKQCQTVFNKLRRLQEFKWFYDRGLEPTCISCGKPKGNDTWCNGHFKTRGAQSGLRYDPMNSYLQHNYHCNQNLSGDIYGTKTTHGYIQGLKNRFGEEEAQKIIDYCETNTKIVKWTWEQLEQMRKEWNKEIRQLEKQLGE